MMTDSRLEEALELSKRVNYLLDYAYDRHVDYHRVTGWPLPSPLDDYIEEQRKYRLQELAERGTP